MRRRFLSKKSSSGFSGTYTVNLNNQWEKTTAVTNPDSSLYDGVYRSSSNYNVSNTAAIMYIDISGLTSFRLCIRSYAESNCDYVMVSQLDQTINNSTAYSSTSLVKAHTRGNQQSGTALSNYTLVEFTGIDGGSHRITVVYRKDSSVHSGDDRGYVLIPKSQESGGDQGGGDVDIDTTYSIMYTSFDGNVVTPYMISALNANITSNTYVNGQGIITFDAPVTSIGDCAFMYCDSLTSVTIPDSVTSIGDDAFYGCTSLTSVTIPDSVTSIGYSAFGNCYPLSSIIIPDSVTEIGMSAFAGCSSMQAVYCKATTPPTGGYDMFRGNVSGRKIYVPTESVDAYKSAQYWSDYADYIVGYDFGDDGEGSLTFPITLVEGYNGQVGVNLFNYLSEKYSAKVLFTEELYFKGTSYSDFDGRITQILSSYNDILVLCLQNNLNVANISLNSNGIVELDIYG